MKVLPERPLKVTDSVSIVTVSPFCQPVASTTVIEVLEGVIFPPVEVVAGVLAAPYIRKLPPLLIVRLYWPADVQLERIRVAELALIGLACVPISNVPPGFTVILPPTNVMVLEVVRLNFRVPLIVVVLAEL